VCTSTKSSAHLCRISNPDTNATSGVPVPIIMWKLGKLQAPKARSCDCWRQEALRTRVLGKHCTLPSGVWGKMEYRTHHWATTSHVYTIMVPIYCNPTSYIWTYMNSRGVNPVGLRSRPPDFWLGGRWRLQGGCGWVVKYYYILLYTGSMFESGNFWREIE